MRILEALNRLDIDGWTRGLLSAGISGGATAISGAIVLPSLDAKDFNIFTAKYWIALGAMSAASSVVSMSKFLSTQPLPSVKLVTTTVETTEVAKKPTVTVTTVEEKHVESVSPELPQK